MAGQQEQPLPLPINNEILERFKSSSMFDVAKELAETFSYKRHKGN